MKTGCAFVGGFVVVWTGLTLTHVTQGVTSLIIAGLAAAVIAFKF